MRTKLVCMIARRAGVAPMLAFALLTVTCGCSADSQLHPVRGRVLCNGEPAVGARVIFHPKNDPTLQGAHPAGVVTADGSFTLTTYKPGDGAPVGDYIVAVTWPDDAAKTGNHGSKHSDNDRLHGKYSDPAKPLLQAQVVAGDNDLPAFDLN